MSNTHKSKTVLAITTSRGLGRYAARITVGQGPTLATAMRKAKELFPELVDAQFADAFADERNEMVDRPSDWANAVAMSFKAGKDSNHA